MNNLNLNHSNATASPAMRPTSEDCAKAKAYSEDKAAKGKWRDPANLRDWLKSRLSEMNPEQVSVDQILTCVLGELEDLGVDLNPAFKLTKIFAIKTQEKQS